MIDIDALEALAKAATPEAWFPETYSSGHRQVCGNLRPIDDDEGAYSVVADVYKREDHKYLIAAQPKVILTLIAEVRALREDTERYRWLRTLDANFYETNRMSEMARFHGETLDQNIDAARGAK